MCFGKTLIWLIHFCPIQLIKTLAVLRLTIDLFLSSNTRKSHSQVITLLSKLQALYKTKWKHWYKDRLQWPQRAQCFQDIIHHHFNKVIDLAFEKFSAGEQSINYKKTPIFKPNLTHNSSYSSPNYYRNNWNLLQIQCNILRWSKLRSTKFFAFRSVDK